MKKLAFFFIFSFIVVFCMQAQTKAFPAAEGFGSLASGGRGGEVVEVTTLEDAATNPPEGSLRWALTQHSGKPLTVVFRVSGLIDLKAELRMKRNNVTIAGQTAPGDGICIMGDKVNLGGSNNVIVRHLRFRVGTMIDPVTGEPDVSGNGSLGYENASNWIIDHCTFGWSGEENMTIYDNKNTTIQWCILHEGLYRSGHNKGDRGYGSQWGGQNATFHHNLLAHNYTRSPRFNGARSNDVNVLIDYVNNVNYNWGKQNSCYGSDIELVSNRTNFVNNYYKPGPARPGNQNSYFTESSYGGIPSRVAVWYMNGNIMEGTANTAKNTDNYLGLDISRYPASATANPMQFRSETPFDIPAEYRVTTETAQEAFESVLAGAGAFPRDTVDRRVVRETREGVATFNGEFDNSGKNGMKGIIDKPEDAEGYPDYETYNTITDNDHDGMDDTWELANGLKPDDPDDRNLYVESGYTALEVYLNGLAGEIIEFQLATSVPPIQDRDWEIFQTRDGLHVTEGVTIEHIRIYNLSGQTFIHKNVNTSKIDISGLSRGIWLAEVITLNQGKRVLKFYK